MQGCEAGAEGEGTRGEAELKVRKGQGLQEAKELGHLLDQKRDLKNKDNFQIKTIISANWLKKTIRNSL